MFKVKFLSFSNCFPTMYLPIIVDFEILEGDSYEIWKYGRDKCVVESLVASRLRSVKFKQVTYEF